MWLAVAFGGGVVVAALLVGFCVHRAFAAAMDWWDGRQGNGE